jgi:hypothetical protein
MTFKAKQRIVWVGWVVLCVWPLVHHALVRATDLHPQEGFAWSMYCVPSRSVGSRETTLDGKQLPIDRLSDKQRRDLQRAKNKYLETRAALGKWAVPDRLARAVFEAFPETDAIKIVVNQARVDRRSAMVVLESTEEYEYRR